MNHMEIIRNRLILYHRQCDFFCGRSDAGKMKPDSYPDVNRDTNGRFLISKSPVPSFQREKRKRLRDLQQALDNQSERSGFKHYPVWLHQSLVELLDLNDHFESWCDISGFDIKLVQKVEQRLR